MYSGGFLNVSNSSIVRNSAQRFGGGILLGTGGTASTCGIATADTVIGANIALHDGQQVYHAGSAIAQFSRTALELNLLESQVKISNAAGIFFVDSTITCPQYSLLSDMYHGMYGNKSIEISSSHCVPPEGSTVIGDVLTSTLEYTCRGW
jgi:hypothetical protein